MSELVTPSAKERSLARGRRLQSVRRSLCLSRQAFSDKFGVSIHTLQNWEMSKNGGLSEKRAYQISELLSTIQVHCSAEWLLYGTGPAPLITNPEALNIQESVQHSDSTQNGLAELELFYKHNPHLAIHLEITDDAHLPYYQPGDIVAGLRHFAEQLPFLNGEICIVHTKAGEQLVRQLKTSELPNRYNLICPNPNTSVNKPILYDVEILMAAPVVWMRRTNN